jgi:hypothetical protein
VRAAPRPFLALPPSGAASSQAVRECRRRGLHVVCLARHLDPPACLAAAGHVSSLSLIPDKPQLAGSLRLAQTRLALFRSWRGRVAVPYLCRACPTKPSPEHLTHYLCSPAVPSNTTTCSQLPPPLTHKRTCLRHLHRNSLVHSRLNVRSARCYLLLA